MIIIIEHDVDRLKNLSLFNYHVVGLVFVSEFSHVPRDEDGGWILFLWCYGAHNTIVFRRFYGIVDGNLL